MLGVNFEGDFNLPLSLERDSSKFQGQADMEHDSEGYGIKGMDGEKRPRREVVSPNGRKEFGTLLGREKRVLGQVHLLLVTIDWQANQCNKIIS